MKNAFSLLEIIIVVVIISILTTFIISKSQDSIDMATKTKIKSEITLIKNSIAKQKTKKVLLDNEELSSLDDANINQLNSKLFNRILDFPLISTNNSIKEIGKWVKISSSDYLIYLDREINLVFSFENSFFTCKSELVLCEDYE